MKPICEKCKRFLRKNSLLLICNNCDKKIKEIEENDNQKENSREGNITMHIDENKVVEIWKKIAEEK